MAEVEAQPGQLLKQTLIANATLEASRRTAANSESEELLDPKTTDRRYWRDPHSGTQREIWRPGKACPAHDDVLAKTNQQQGTAMATLSMITSNVRVQ